MIHAPLDDLDPMLVRSEDEDISCVVPDLFVFLPRPWSRSYLGGVKSLRMKALAEHDTLEELSWKTPL